MWSDYPCIETTWARTDDGYGRRYVGWDKPREYAHRAALAEKLGRPLGPGVHACHHCDNPPCVQQEHLFEGTESDNRRDMCAKGRRWSTPQEVREAIERRYFAGGVTLQQLADEFDLGQTTVWRFVHKVV